MRHVHTARFARKWGIGLCCNIGKVRIGKNNGIIIFGNVRTIAPSSDQNSSDAEDDDDVGWEPPFRDFDSIEWRSPGKAKKQKPHRKVK
jgi:hypothetical protein